MLASSRRRNLVIPINSDWSRTQCHLSLQILEGERERERFIFIFIFFVFKIFVDVLINRSLLAEYS